MDHHCRIATVRLKYGYLILDCDYIRTGLGAFYRRIGHATWEWISPLQYVRAVR